MSFAGPVFNTSHAGGNAQITNISGNVTYVLSEAKAEKIYKWLDAPDSSGNFVAAKEKRHEKTGTWFIEGKEYIEWKETPDSALWVYGTPGCGKSVICSTVIEEIQHRCSENSAYACAYFFFDNRNAQTDQALHHKLIRSIIQQLCDQSDGVPAPLVDIYGNGRQQVSIASLQSTLQKIMDGFERTYIIIDALDECTNRDKVLAWIKELMQWKAGKIHVLFLSRPEQDIKDKLRCLAYIARVTLNSRLAERDIKTYIDAMLSLMINKWDAQTIARARDALFIRSEGMFRWVALQISELLKCCTRRAVDDQLRDLPKDLEGMYERSLLNSPRRPDLKRFLMWLAFSSRPLELQELADVVTVDLSSNIRPSYDANLRYFSPADMLITCSSFVTEVEVRIVTFGNQTIRLINVMKLAHMSVKDYLVSDRLKNGPASYFSINVLLSHSMITKTCLAYLFHLRNLCCINDFVLESVPLGSYAAAYWIGHMRLGGGEDAHLSQIMHCIFSLGESALVNWVRLYDPDFYSLRGQNLDKPPAKIAEPLYYACSHGLQRTGQQILVGGAPVNAEGGKCGNALQAASFAGHDDIVRLLLDKGADVNAHGGYYGYALQAASYRGHNDIMRSLLEQGAEVNAQGGVYGNALRAALYHGHDAIVRLLLEQGAQVNVQGGLYGNALQAALYYGHDGSVRLLLEEGAEVNIPGGPHGNALQGASHYGHDVIVRLLLKHGAEVNAQGGPYGNALQAASKGGHDAIVRLLLEKGSGVNAQGGKWGHALQAASRRGHNTIVRLLLENGACANAQGGYCGNALLAASKGGHGTTVLLLFEHGADVNAQTRPPGNELQATSKRGHDAVARLLLEEGADVNMQGRHYGNALQAASRGGHDVVARLLLENGADVNAQGGKWGNALQAASKRAHNTTILLLLEQGAIVNMQGGKYGSALKAGRSGPPFGQRGHKGHELTVKLLLEHGAVDNNIEDEESSSSECEDSDKDSEDDGSYPSEDEDRADYSSEDNESYTDDDEGSVEDS